MSDDATARPTAPNDVPGSVTDALEDCSPAQLRRIADYASDLAAARDGGATDEEQEEGADEDDATTGEDGPDQDDPEDRPDEVPPNATVTIKEINDNRYYYWQWREGDAIKSKYKRPVDPDE